MGGRRVSRGAVVVTALALILSASSPSAADFKVRGPWTLVTLAALGSVTWRCDASRHPGLAPGLPGLALGFHVTPRGQTGTLRLIAAARTVVNRVIQPGQTIELPFLRTRVQRLEVAEAGEDGTLRAVVTVNFEASPTSPYCFSYMPPGVEVRLSPRR
jgi:hypothetical protein